MKNISRIIFATVIVSILLVGCGNKKVVETEELATLEENTTESEDTAPSEEAVEEEAEAPQRTTIESFFNENPEELQKAIDDMDVSNGEVKIEAHENTVIYTFILAEAYSEEQIEAMVKDLNLDSEEIVEEMNNGKKEFSVFVDAKWEDITIVIKYIDAAGHEVINKTY